jgi:tRNA pseudouridine32 synthase/23S rRNA pseudouridine746 synthase
VSRNLARRSGLPHTKIKQAMTKGAVWVPPRRCRRRRKRRATTPLNPRVRIGPYDDEAILNRRPPATDCLAQRRNFSVWYKPAGMLTQGTHFRDHCSRLRAAQAAFKMPRPLHAVHRPDREALGLVLVGHDRRATAILSALFRRRQVLKCNRAVVTGRLTASAGRETIDTRLDGRTAVTHYRPLPYESFTDRTIVDIWIATGRRHQIRRHFDGLGHALAGDPRYGSRIRDMAGLQLWATRLECTCPIDGQRRTYTLPATDMETTPNRQPERRRHHGHGP